MVNNTANIGATTVSSSTSSAQPAVAAADRLAEILNELRQTRHNQSQKSAGNLAMIEEIHQIRLAQEQILQLAAPITSRSLRNVILQLFGIGAAILFGVFTILAWTLASTANQISSKANDISSSANEDSRNQALQDAWNSKAQNQLALAAYCSDVSIIGSPTWIAVHSADAAELQSREPLCASVRSVAAASLTSFASSYFGIPSSSPSTTSGPIPTAPSGGSADAGSQSSGVLVGVVIGSILGLVLLAAFLYATFASFRTQKRRSDQIRRVLEKSQ